MKSDKHFTSTFKQYFDYENKRVYWSCAIGKIEDCKLGIMCKKCKHSYIK